MRNDRPTPRAASGSRLYPKMMTKAAMMIIQCHQDRAPMLNSSSTADWPLVLT